jgi:L-alanine-DL-glutamate epimerase-like enolase superfamily enzyme
MIGSMNETSLGSAAIGRLAPLFDYLDMDGPLLLAEDIASGIQYDYGKVIMSDLPGLGVEMNEVKS